jgi:hypothetical protein
VVDEIAPYFSGNPCYGKCLLFDVNISKNTTIRYETSMGAAWNVKILEFTDKIIFIKALIQTKKI